MSPKKSLGNEYAQFLAPTPAESPEDDIDQGVALSIEAKSDSSPAAIIPEATKRKARKPTAKSKDPNYIQTSVYLPKSLHLHLRVAAMQEGRDVSVLLAELAEQWLQSRK